MKELVQRHLGSDNSFESGKTKGYAVLGLRVMMGWIFLTSGLSKLIDNGFAYKYASIYLSKATPVAVPDISMSFPEVLGAPGILLVEAGTFVVEPLMNIFASLSFIGPLVVLTELLLGTALLLGVLTRLAAVGGSVLMVFFYYGNAEWKHGLVNGDFVYMAVLVALAAFNAGKIYGADSYISKNLRPENKWLKLVLGVEGE
ncbi:MAG: DoxX family membrane protein [Candidatus Nanohalobium sp.]